MFTKLKIAALKAARAVCFVAAIAFFVVAGRYIIIGFVLFTAARMAIDLLRAFFAGAKAVMIKPVFYTEAA